MAEPQFGDTARDTITGFTGIVTGRCNYITGCDQILLAPPAKDNEYKRSEWFDLDRVEVITPNSYVLPVAAGKTATPGPDRAAPTK